MEKPKKKTQKLKLDAKKTKEITDFIVAKRAEKIDDKEIRKLIFKQFQIDITLYEFKWAKKGKVSSKPVEQSRALMRTNNIVKKKEMTNYKHFFTDKEVRTKAETISDYLIEINTLEEQKKSVMSDFKSKIDDKQEKANTLSRQIHAGFEMKQDELEVVKDFEAGTKKGYLNGKLVLDERLTTADYTLQFPEE